MALTAKEKFDLKKFVNELKQHRARHTEFVSVYIPAGYDINKVVNQIAQEQGTASNIKSTSTRKNVQDALEKMIQQLRLYKRTPPNGLAVFSGNVAEREGQQDIKAWSLEPPVPLNVRMYRCEKEFQTEVLEEMMMAKECYALVVMDKREGDVALLRGKAIIPMASAKSNVPGKTRSGGQCLVKDSAVQLSEGGLPRIEDVHNPHNVISADWDNHRMSMSNVTDKWNVKKGEMFRITTKNPRLQLECSKDHVLFGVGKEGIVEIPADRLRVGNSLIMPEKIDVKGEKQKIESKQYYNYFIISKSGQEIIKRSRLKSKLKQKDLAKVLGVTQTCISTLELGKRNVNGYLLKRVCNQLEIEFEKFIEKHTKENHKKGTEVELPKEIDTEFAQFIGYLIGDGSIETGRITFFEQEKDLALKYKNKFDKYFRIDSSYRFRDDKNYHQIRFTSRPLVRLIKKEFPELKKALDSEIPEKILASEDRVVAAFLRGIYDAEGYVNPYRGVSLGINNKRLAQQLQMVLLRFGIISSLHEYDNRANKYSDNPRFVVDITECISLEKFSKFVGFTSNVKRDKLNNVISKKTKKSNARQIIFPGSFVRKLIEEAGHNLELFPKVNNFFRNERMMSKEVFKDSVLSNVKDDKLHRKLMKIYNSRLLPVKIQSIERVKRKTEMIDISVSNESFIANGLIVHNSAQRFERLREGAAKDFFIKIGTYVKEALFPIRDQLKGIIVGGPGMTKQTFVDGNYITADLKNKIIAIKDLSYTGEFGLQELLDLSQDVLAEEEVAEEKKAMQQFFDLLAKQPGKISYGDKEVKEKMALGAVDIVLLSESLDEDVIVEFDELAKPHGTEVKIISVDTREGAQLRDMGKIAAILRYEA